MNIAANKLITVHPYQRCYFVGDIHGCHKKLMNKLHEIGFRFDTDLLISTGDILNRGPESLMCLDLIDKPWFFPVYGNHEEFVLKMAKGLINDELQLKWRNEWGGEWYFEFENEKRSIINTYIINQIMQMPASIKVNLPCGKSIGCLHAQMPVNNWNEMLSALKNGGYKVIQSMITPRDLVKKVMSFNQGDNYERPNAHIKGVDAVVFGHFGVEQPVVHDNCVWIDTGYYSGLTVLSADEILAMTDSDH